MRPGLRLALLMLALVCASCAPRKLMGVVVITLDTTRADRLSPYGFQDAVLPALDRLAREGIVFDQATTVVPLTLPAHASLFTGLWPPRHGVRTNISQTLASQHDTLAEVLRTRGFRTAAFVGSVVLDADRGLNQGFEVYSDVSSGRERRGGAVMDEAIDWLAQASGTPFLLWTHLYDPHLPYEAPMPFAGRHDPYVAEVAYVDAQIARLLAALDEHNLKDRVAIVVVADHGESLGDHGEMDHSVFLYESVMRVPLIMRAPGFAPGRVPWVVRLIDVMPTILDFLGVSHATQVDGVSLVETMRGRNPDLEAYTESLYPPQWGWAPLFALRDGRFKLIDSRRPELYDLERDPFEERNIIAERSELAESMTSRLRVLRGEPSADSDPTIEPEVRARLAALGYISGRAAAPSESWLRLPDAKDCSGVYKSGRCVTDGEFDSRTTDRPR